MLIVNFLIGELILRQVGQEDGVEYFKHRQFNQGDLIEDYAGNKIGICKSIEFDEDREVKIVSIQVS